MTDKSHSGPVRVRYAPSPTGDPHVGNLRTALLNWVFARHAGGQFIVRIEDTDRERMVDGSLDRILSALEWLGLDWDEGPGVDGPHAPYVQSDRKALGKYAKAAQMLIDNGQAYECTCTPERLDQVRLRQRAEKKPTGYDSYCRNKSDEERTADKAQGLATVVRFKVPLEGEVVFNDVLRGPLTFDPSLLQDFVILKSDGYPTYHLAHIVDDHDMGITHVLRSEEWISSTPRHVMVYEGFGWEPPAFVHLSILLGPDRAKLSKRHGDTALLEFRDKGFLPETMFNFLSLLGWSAGDDEEVMTREQIVEKFSLDGLNAAPSIFNITKLEWMNGVYLRQLPVHALAEILIPELEAPDGLPASISRPLDRDYVTELVPLVHERLKVIDREELAGMLAYFFQDEIELDPAAVVQKGMNEAATASALESAAVALESAEAFESEPLEEGFRALCVELGLKPRQFFGALRVALTARRVAPPLFDTMVALGRERSIARVRRAAALLLRDQAVS
ncbi:MAG TPA: glutamate--tRNA ligase [Dehalococcoidia bacterium]|nr:glutamate--tRNA ligase [Chloroflexota bacterium]MDP5877115.1 glutamate--tRNA ligase [Dehalococcoidia bacterium]MDP6273171.1 glutamate--tRNA ligase [Dehalococcoidia bacterium]MDP7213978.1 glutamate--tRNA ligase [Dehalococcoidia bacterium]MDP7514446.1 glutamate--tRNA ligase [Dehalococcoidia bacterium]